MVLLSSSLDVEGLRRSEQKKPFFSEHTRLYLGGWSDDEEGGDAEKTAEDTEKAGEDSEKPKEEVDAETLKQKQIAEMKNEGMEKFCARLGFSQPNAAKEIAASMIQVRVKKVHNVPSLK